MANIPVELKYSDDHEWCRVEGDYAYVGITDFAQSELGDIVFVYLFQYLFEIHILCSIK